MSRSFVSFVSLSLALSLALALSACSPSSLAHDSAPEIGCAAEDITVDEMNMPLEGPSSWSATCEGQRWFCSRADTRVICTEDPRPKPTPTAEPGKGATSLVDGRSTSPRALDPAHAQ